MNYLKKLLCLICCVIISSCSQHSNVLHDAQGNLIQVSSLKGKWVIINYWAAWCESCRKEIPALNNFYQHNQNKNIVLYGVNYDRMPMDDLELAMHKMQITYPVLLDDPAHTWALDGIDALPVTFIIDPNGQVVKKILGVNTEKSLQDVIHSLQKTL